MPVESEPSERGLSALLGRVADGMSRLVVQHLTLARLEVQEDIKVWVQNLARIAVFAPFVVLGYALLTVALSVWISQWLGLAGAFAVVGGLHVLAGGVGVGMGVSKISRNEVMPETQQELSRSAAVLSASGETSSLRKDHLS